MGWQRAKMMRVLDADTYDLLVDGATTARVRLQQVDAL